MKNRGVMKKRRGSTDGNLNLLDSGTVDPTRAASRGTERRRKRMERAAEGTSADEDVRT